MLTVVDHNVATGEIIERPASELELKNFNLDIERDAAAIDEKTMKETALAEARAALLDRLGITADEAALLLG